MRGRLRFRADLRGTRLRLTASPTSVADTAVGPITYTERGDGYCDPACARESSRATTRTRAGGPQVLASHRLVSDPYPATGSLRAGPRRTGGPSAGGHVCPSSPWTTATAKRIAQHPKRNIEAGQLQG